MLYPIQLNIVNQKTIAPFWNTDKCYLEIFRQFRDMQLEYLFLPAVVIIFNANQFSFIRSVNQLNNKVVIIRFPFGICIEERQFKRIHIAWTNKNWRKQYCGISFIPTICNPSVIRTAVRRCQWTIVSIATRFNYPLGISR